MRIRSRLVPPDWLPTMGQAAIAVETRAGDARVIGRVKVLDDARTHRNVSAERALNAAMGGDCTMPLGAWCETAADGTLHLRGLPGDALDGWLLRVDARGDDPAPLRKEVAGELQAPGVAGLLASCES